MIGASKIQSQVVANSNYVVNITPGGDFLVVSTNGSSTSARHYSNIVSGTGPFEYLWTVDNNEIRMTSPISADTAFYASGFNEEKSGNITLTVTDLGNGNAETSRDMTILFIFETLGF